MSSAKHNAIHGVVHIHGIQLAQDNRRTGLAGVRNGAVVVAGGSGSDVLDGGLRRYVISADPIRDGGIDRIEIRR